MPQIGLIGGGWIDIHIHSALRADEAHDPQSCVQKQGAPVLDPFKMVMVSCHVASREGGKLGCSVPCLPQSPKSRMSKCHVGRPPCVVPGRPLNTWLTVSDNECAGRTKTNNVLLVTVACFRRLLCIEFERYSVSRCRITERESSSIVRCPSRLLAGRVSRRRCRPRARKKKDRGEEKRR